MIHKQKCVRCGKPLSRFEAHEITHCIEQLCEERDMLRARLDSEEAVNREHAQQARRLIAERDKLALTIGGVYMAISKIAADPAGNDTAALVDIMTTIDKVLGKDGE